MKRLLQARATTAIWNKPSCVRSTTKSVMAIPRKPWKSISEEAQASEGERPANGEFKYLQLQDHQPREKGSSEHNLLANSIFEKSSWVTSGPQLLKTMNESTTYRPAVKTVAEMENEVGSGMRSAKLQAEMIQEFTSSGVPRQTGHKSYGASNYSSSLKRVASSSFSTRASITSDWFQFKYFEHEKMEKKLDEMEASSCSDFEDTTDGRENLGAPRLLSADEISLNNLYVDYVTKMFMWRKVTGKKATKRQERRTDLKEMRQLAEAFGNPQQNLKFIHIAGTNGKGTCSLKVAKGLQKMGFKTGLFISPHINTFRERLQVNGEFVSKERVVEMCEDLFKVVEKLDLNLRFFELFTMLAFMEFNYQKCDYVVMECGIGGRLDSTNVIDDPICSAITSIGLDHTDVIGNDMEDIAFEKAGVIKPGRPCVVGPTAMSLKNITEKAAEVEGEVIQIPELKTHTRVNNAIVKNILEVVSKEEGMTLRQDVLDDVKNITQPCRFERVKGRKDKIFLDVGHNFQGISNIMNKIKVDFPEIDTVKIAFTFSKKKKLEDTIALFEKDPLIKEVSVMSRPHMRLERADVAYRQIKDTGLSKLKPFVVKDGLDNSPNQMRTNFEQEFSDYEPLSNEAPNNIEATLNNILADGPLAENELLLICGSFFIMTDVRQYFGYVEEVDEYM